MLYCSTPVEEMKNQRIWRVISTVEYNDILIDQFLKNYEKHRQQCLQQGIKENGEKGKKGREKGKNRAT